MKTNELFKIIDACEPSISQIKAYLERMSGEMPFEIVIRKNGQELRTKTLEQGENVELVGFVLGDVLIYFKPFTKSDGKNPTLEAILAFGKELSPSAQPLGKEQILLWAAKEKKYSHLRERLGLFGYKIPKQPANFVFFRKEKALCLDVEFDEDFLTEVNLEKYLDSKGKIFFYTTIATD